MFRRLDLRFKRVLLRANWIIDMNIFTQKFIRSTVQGFTLVETLAATFVITVVILGPLTVAINASA